MQHPLPITLFVVGLTLIGVFLALGQHAVDQPRQFVRRRRHRLGFVHAGAQPAEIGAQRRLAGAQCRSRQPQRLCCSVRAPFGLAAHHLATGDLRARTQSQPRREVLVRRESAHVGSDLADDHQRGGHVDAVDAREVHAAHLEQPRAQVELRRVAGLAALLAFVRLDRSDVQPLQLRLDFLVALRKLLAAEVERVQRLPQREQVLGAPSALQACLLYTSPSPRD